MLTTLIKLIIAAVICIGITLFVSLNTHDVSLRIWPEQTGLSVQAWAVVLSSLAFGLIVGAGLFWFQMLILKAQIRRLKKQLENTSSGATPLRHLTITNHRIDRATSEFSTLD